ncbi:hypothetical protein IR083_07180 [Dysgonomonas sp. GY75]|uniref:hypothetical protein n=1 Tax=Dysgonomonas sp. GY75 TaxID=2780419 RepID=UPI00188327E3|nr:hypothetical protein [Dysgonomonas sp. GY75]MBF0648597.1 hypothetical protein [Dysgonomonas sp. GY75]
MVKKLTADDKQILSIEEEQFCELFVYGGSEYAGRHVKCYAEVFGEGLLKLNVLSRKLLAKVEIQSRIRELMKDLQCETENMAIKLQVAETLKAVMEETSTAQFSDKSGIDLSPAPLRAVSVNAAKALMELYPIRHVHEARLRIESGGGGIVFNVIVPENKSNEPDEER